MLGSTADFNTTAFGPTPGYEIGNAGRNILRQRSFFNWDISALEGFPHSGAVEATVPLRGLPFHQHAALRAGGKCHGNVRVRRHYQRGRPRNLQFGMKAVW